MKLGRWLPALGFVIAAHPPSAARAAEPFPEPTVDVTIVGGDRDAEAILEAVREPLTALGLRVHTGAPPASVAKQAIRVRIEVHDGLTELVIDGVHGSRTEVRRSLPRDPDAPPTVLAEDVAYAVRATLESLLAEPPPVPVPPVIPPRIVPAPPPPVVAGPSPIAAAPREERFGVDVAALGTVRVIGSVPSGPSPGTVEASGGALGADLAFWGRRRFRPSVWVIVTVDAPFQAMTSEVALSTMVYSVRAGPSVELGRAGPLRFAVGAGAGVDIFHAQGSPTDVDPVSLDDATRADAIAGLLAVVRARLFDSAGLFLAGAVDYDITPHDYAEQIGMRQSEVVAPWRVRPGLYLGVCFRATGASGCAGTP